MYMYIHIHMCIYVSHLFVKPRKGTTIEGSGKVCMQHSRPPKGPRTRAWWCHFFLGSWGLSVGEGDGALHCRALKATCRCLWGYTDGPSLKATAHLFKLGSPAATLRDAATT